MFVIATVGRNNSVSSSRVLACPSCLQQNISTYTVIGISDEWDLSMQVFGGSSCPTHRKWTRAVYKNVEVIVIATVGRNNPVSNSHVLACFSCLQKLLSTYTAIGIFEEWGLSMQLFDATVTSPVSQWDAGKVANIGLRSPEREALLDWAHTSSELFALLAPDLLLYEFALSVFQRQTRDILGKVWS